jgi:flagellar motor switch protein FliG
MASDASTETALATTPDLKIIEGMPGAQRAAVLLLILGDKHGAPIWASLDEEEVKKVSYAMAQLGPVDAPTAEAVVVHFVTQFSGLGGVSGNFDRTEELLLKIFPPDQVSEIMADIRGASGHRMWQRLSQIDPEVLANYLRNEYPQTVAVILSRVRPDLAAQILSLLPDEFAVEVLNRMLKMDSVQKEALEHIEEMLRTEFVSTIGQATRRDAYKSIAEVFNAFDRQAETRFMEALDQTNREAARKIRELMFTFEDLLKLDPGSIQTLMRQIDKETLGKALKGASETVRTFFFANMSTRAAKNLQDEMAAMGPIRLKSVDEAQGRIVLLAKELADKGEIMLAKNRAEEELVY